jgi:hypothetical protein
VTAVLAVAARTMAGPGDCDGSSFGSQCAASSSALSNALLCQARTRTQQTNHTDQSCSIPVHRRNASRGRKSDHERPGARAAADLMAVSDQSSSFPAIKSSVNMQSLNSLQHRSSHGWSEFAATETKAARHTASRRERKERERNQHQKPGLLRRHFVQACAQASNKR